MKAIIHGILRLLLALVAAYLSYLALTVVDFIELFVRKREEKFYTDADFEAADAKK